MSAPVYRRGRSCFTLRYAIRWRLATAVLLHRDVWLLHRRADRPGEQPVGPTATAHLQGPAVRRSARQTPLGRPADPIENDRLLVSCGDTKQEPPMLVEPLLM